MFWNSQARRKGTAVVLCGCATAIAEYSISLRGTADTRTNGLTCFERFEDSVKALYFKVSYIYLQIVCETDLSQ